MADVPETIHSLRAAIDANDRLYAQRWESADRALGLALDAANKRLDAISAGLQRIELAGAGFPSKLDTLNQFDRADTRIKAVESKISNYDGRLWMLGAVFTIANVILTLIFSHWLR
jgi:hypothetical protein